MINQTHNKETQKTNKKSSPKPIKQQIINTTPYSKYTCTKQKTQNKNNSPTPNNNKPKNPKQTQTPKNKNNKNHNKYQTPLNPYVQKKQQQL